MHDVGGHIGGDYGTLEDKSQMFMESLSREFLQQESVHTN